MMGFINLGQIVIFFVSYHLLIYIRKYGALIVGKVKIT